MSQNISAIDIGSNAIRISIAEVFLTHDHIPSFRVHHKYRYPLRLGGDVFKYGHIKSETVVQATHYLAKFVEINQRYQVQKSKAVATSATREADNGKLFCNYIENSLGIKIHILTGQEEAALIFNAVKYSVSIENHQVLLFDIGGGSIELTYVEKGLIKATKSFPIGTVRLLNLQTAKKLRENQLSILIGDTLNEMSNFFTYNNILNQVDYVIGTGGNVEAFGKLKYNLLNIQNANSCTQGELHQIYNKLINHPIEERIKKFKLRPDRADVIIPALLLTDAILTLSGANHLFIPNVGLREGVLIDLLKS